MVNIIFKKLLKFKKQIIYYTCGKYNENYFKTIRLQFGIYRQKHSYMIRICYKNYITYNNLYFLSYLIKKFDTGSLHFSTRMNIQLNWIKFYNIYNILFYNNILFINSIQSSGNCIRNVTFNYKNFNNNYIWINLIKFWFYLNYDFLFLPRKFKISINNFFNNFNSFKFNDICIYIKNLDNKLKFNIFIGGGLGRSPLIGKLLFKNLHWKYIINICYKILKIYNIFGFRNNIYKSKLKILFKNLNKKKIKNLLNYEKNIKFLILNEKELNNFKNKNKIIYNFYFFKKKIKYNIFFLNWLIINNSSKFNFIILNYFKPSGDLNYFQIKFISNFKLKILNNEKQNIIFNSNVKYIYNIYSYLIKFNLNNIKLNYNLSCPGINYCNLANSNSINLSKLITYNYLLYNNLIKLSYYNLNISGCINSCSHNLLSNIGFLGFKKNLKDFFKIFIGSNLNFINLSNLKSSFKKNKIIIFYNFLLKIYIKNKKSKEIFINTYNRIEYKFLC